MANSFVCYKLGTIVRKMLQRYLAPEREVASYFEKKEGKGL